MPVYTVRIYDDGEYVGTRTFSCYDDVLGYQVLAQECGLQTACEISVKVSASPADTTV